MTRKALPRPTLPPAAGPSRWTSWLWLLPVTAAFNLNISADTASSGDHRTLFPVASSKFGVKYLDRYLGHFSGYVGHEVVVSHRYTCICTASQACLSELESLILQMCRSLHDHRGGASCSASAPLGGDCPQALCELCPGSLYAQLATPAKSQAG